MFHGESNPAPFRLRGRYGNAKTNNLCGSMSAKPSRFVTSSFTCATSTPNLCGPSEKETHRRKKYAKGFKSLVSYCSISSHSIIPFSSLNLKLPS